MRQFEEAGVYIIRAIDVVGTSAIRSQYDARVVKRHNVAIAKEGGMGTHEAEGSVRM